MMTTQVSLSDFVFYRSMVLNFLCLKYWPINILLRSNTFAQFPTTLQKPTFWKLLKWIFCKCTSIDYCFLHGILNLMVNFESLIMRNAVLFEYIFSIFMAYKTFTSPYERALISSDDFFMISFFGQNFDFLYTIYSKSLGKETDLKLILVSDI